MQGYQKDPGETRMPPSEVWTPPLGKSFEGFQNHNLENIIANMMQRMD